MTETDSIHGISRDSRWQQSGTTYILINAIHWPQRPCSAPCWSDRDGKRPSVKADLAIGSHVLSVSEELSFKGTMRRYGSRAILMISLAVKS